ncbi:MAG: glycosyltransferase family 2 protein [Pirellulales bacterium]
MATTVTSTTSSLPSPGAGLHMIVSIPALNEENTVCEVIRAIPRTIPGVDVIDVIVIDDGCSDNTAKVACEAGAHVIRHATTRGVGAAFQSALRVAIEQGTDVLVTIDADGQFDPNDIPKLAAPILSGDADFSTASRFVDPKLTPRMPWIKLWGNRQMSRLVSRLTRSRFYDVSCGMRCYGRRAMANLNPMGDFTYTQEVFLNLAFKRMRIVEVPIAVRGERTSGESRVANNLWRYGMNTTRIILRAYRDYQPLRFFGGLALLLAVPAALLAGFLLIYYLRTGGFSPYKWTGFAAGTLAILSLVFLHMGILGDMLNRHRLYLEELLADGRMGRGRKKLPLNDLDEDSTDE